MRTRIDERRTNPQTRLLFVALVLLGLALLTAIPVLAAGGIDLFDQCANGSAGTAEPWCPGTGTDWTKGNVNPSNGQWQPGQLVPQRLGIRDLTAGTTYSVTISWLAFEQNKTAHSYDYIGTYNGNAPSAQPCDGITGCIQASPTMTYPIPVDPSLKLSCGFAGVSPTYPRPLWFTIWNATITGLSSYSYSTSKSLTTNDGIDANGCLITNTNTYTGLTLTFTAGSSTNDTVIAWAGHIASDLDWGTGHAAPSIQGASYHMDIVACGDGINGCGSQDNQVQIGQDPTAVTLSNFGASQAMPAQVTLDWTTASEIDTAGFNVYRSSSPDGPYDRINVQLIPVAADSLVGGKYQYLDNNLVPGRTYYYQLEDVELNGRATRHPAIAVTATTAASEGFGSATTVAAGAVGALAVLGAGFILVRRRTRPS